MYDEISSTYDHFVNWKNRLAFEMPFLEAQLARVQTGSHPLRVLDAACGTAMHAIELARRGYSTAGADISAGMIAQARANADAAGVQVNLAQAGFGALRAAFGAQPFDGILCLGNSLPHLLSLADLEAALADFAASLKPGGLLLIQNRNFDAVLNKQDRFMDPQSYRAGDEEQIFLRFYDFRPDGLLDFHMLTLLRAAEGWKQQVTSSQLYPLRREELEQALLRVGFRDVTMYSGLNGSAFDENTSPNTVAAAFLP